jgi:MtN3 and saliva related transmembrane protein
VTASAIIESIGFAAAVLTTLCWVPQAVKLIRERDTRSISLPMTLILVAGLILWLVYGLALSNAPLIASNTVTLVLVLVILALKLRHG